jgi:carbon-monoxide dehydrogenase medium subunit
MHAFEYIKTHSAAEAAKLAAAGAKVLAGGQTLLPTMKQRLASPEKLADLGGIAELVGIKKEGNAFVIGAMTRHADVASHKELHAAIPGLSELAAQIGDKQVRAMGTLGGSVANNDPAACYPSAVLALNATIHTTQRKIAADDFFTGMYSTALHEDEIITAISFPIPKHSAYAKFKQPASRFALVGVFVAQTDHGVRVAVTGAANCVFRHHGLEAALDKSYSAQALEGVHVDAAELNADIHASAAYRAHLITVQTQRAVAHSLA